MSRIIPAAAGARSGQSQRLQAQGRALFCESCWYLLEKKKGEMLQAQEERRKQQVWQLCLLNVPLSHGAGVWVSLWSDNLLSSPCPGDPPAESRTPSPPIPFSWACGPCRIPCPQGLSHADPVPVAIPST